jgi:hypothetical protein
VRSFVFLGESGGLVSGRPADPSGQIESESLAGQVDVLSRMVLVAQYGEAAVPVTLRIRPDRALITALLKFQGTGALQSRFLITKRPLESGAGPEFVVCFAEYVHQQERYELVEVREEGLSVWAKIALTPVTLSLDLVGGIIWGWLSSLGDPDDDESKRRSGESDQESRAREHEEETGH